MADLIERRWNEFTLGVWPDDRITLNFKFYEQTRSEAADRRGIENSFTSINEVHAAVHLCRKVLHQDREASGGFLPTAFTGVDRWKG